MNIQQAQGAFLMSRRTDFIGRNDKYATTNTRIGSISEAMNGFGPFDVTKTLFDDRLRETAVTRINRYRINWRYYRGEHWLNAYYDGERKPVYNFCSMIVDKAVDFCAARGWKVKMARGNEQVAQALDMVWEANNKALLTQTIKQYASVTGDAFVYVTVNTLDPKGQPLTRDKWQVALIPLNPSYCFPHFDANGAISRILIQYPVSDNPTNNSLYSVVIDKDTFQLFQDDSPITPPQPNPFGAVNVVHFKNLPLAYSKYGLSDLDNVIPLNQSYNETCFSIERIIRYHAEPTTIIQGARATSLEKGANKVWSNIPKDGKVYNLEMTGDLAAMKTYLEILKKQLCEVSCTPEVALDGSTQSRSNVSAISLELTYKPLIDKTQRSRDCMGPAFNRVNQLILKAHSSIILEPLETLGDYPDLANTSRCDWSSAMPRDEAAELAIAKLKYDLGLTTKAALLRQFNDFEDFEQAAIEMAADKMAELAQGCEIARAQQGIPPMLSTAFLGSQFINEDLKDLASQVASLDEKYAAKQAPLVQPAQKPADPIP